MIVTSVVIVVCSIATMAVLAWGGVGEAYIDQYEGCDDSGAASNISIVHIYIYIYMYTHI